MKAHLRHETNDPGTIAWRGLRARVFAGHAYAKPSDGAPETLDALARADMGAAAPRG